MAMSLDDTCTSGDFMRELGVQGYDSLVTPISAATPQWVFEQASMTASGKTVYEDGTVEALGDYFGIDAKTIGDLTKPKDYLSVASSKDSSSDSSSEDSLSVASSEDSVASEDSEASSKDSVASSKDSVASSTKSSVSYHKHPIIPLSSFTHHATFPIHTPFPPCHRPSPWLTRT